MKYKVVITAATLLLMVQQKTMAQGEVEQQGGGDSETRNLEEIISWGRASEFAGSADSASQGLVGYADFSTRPLMRVGELVEVVPGMVATQHSGPGKANQYFLRGMNLDHGSDFSASFDGVPVNFRSHAHAQGYLDLNFIIPEIVETMEFRKGPYFADRGDFSVAGSVAFETYNRLPQGFLEISASDHDDYRLVTADSFDLNEGALLYAAEVQYRDGPWDLPQDVKKYNGLVKYSGSWGDYETELMLTGYRSEWNSTDQIPERLVDDGTLSRFGYIDPDIGGESEKFGVSGRVGRDGIQAQLYATYYSLNLLSNPTYFLNDPVNGDEIEQEDQRMIFGGSYSYQTETSFFGMQIRPKYGAEFRYDDVRELNLFNTRGKERIGIVRADEVQELSLALYGEWEIQFNDRFRTTLGLRGDHYRFDVSATRAENSGDGSESVLQPKLGLAYLMTEDAELYANYGQGFHSNDVRGVTIQTDPVSGDPAHPVDAVVDAEGAELGLRYEAIEGLKLTLAGFWLELDSELLFVGDAGTSEPNDATRRTGIELSAFWQANDWLVLDLTATKVRGRFKGNPPGGSYIPDAHGRVVSAGATVVTDSGLTASLRVRHFGDAPLTEDNTVEKGDSTVVNLGLSYNFGRFDLGIDALNIFDAEDDDIAFFFESQLANEAAPVEDIHFHPMEPRTIRASVRYKF